MTRKLLFCNVQSPFRQETSPAPTTYAIANSRARIRHKYLEPGSVTGFPARIDKAVRALFGLANAARE
jgi:hypothetical protein